MLGLPRWCNGKDLPVDAEIGLIPGWGRSPGEGNDNPLQCSCQENPMDRGAWQAIVWGVGVWGSQRVGHNRACTNANPP